MPGMRKSKSQTNDVGLRVCQQGRRRRDRQPVRGGVVVYRVQRHKLWKLRPLIPPVPDIYRQQDMRRNFSHDANIAESQGNMDGGDAATRLKEEAGLL
jgi:hypothetical protein